jgi:methyl-accepting chemotaxis protein
VDVARILSYYARAVAILGATLLLAGAALDPRWATEIVGIAVVLGATIGLRVFQIPLTKYSALNLLGMIAVGGALLIGAPATAIGLYVGILLADWLLLRKALTSAWVNAGRETLALYGAYGFFAWLSSSHGAAVQATLTADAVPAISLFISTQFVFSRVLLYATLLLRNKLLDDEKSLILRYEVIAFGAGTSAVVVSLITISSVGWNGWMVVTLVLIFAGLLLKRILEESIAAEELNKIHAMEQVVSSDAGLADSFSRIERLANRLVEWNGFRILRVEQGEVAVLYEGNRGLLDPPQKAGEIGLRLRTMTLESGEPLVITDAARDQRIDQVPPGARSMVVVPLRFGERLLGLLELDHHKRGTYGDKELALIMRFATQIATALHIHDLRQPLLEAVRRVGRQLDTLNESARQLRAGGEAVARTIGDITRGITEESEQASRSLEVAHTLHQATAAIAQDGRDAAVASERATRIASENRGTIATAIDRLVNAKKFVGESSSQLGELARSTERITDFISVIKEIADQTNLLALNAAIEAARAGVHGSGFAVVADEVRKLAEQSAQASEAAAEIVLNFHEQMRRAASQVEHGQSMVGDVETLSESALTALDAIVEATGSSVEWARRIADTSNSQEREFGRLRERVARIADISHRNRAGAENVTSSAVDQARALRELEGAAHELRGVAVYLGDLTRQLTSVS